MLRRSRIIRLRLLPDRLRLDTFVGPFLQVNRAGWYLIILRVQKQHQPWLAMLRLSCPNGPDQELPLLRPDVSWVSNIRLEIAYLAGSIDCAEVQVHGARWLPDAISLLLQPVPPVLAALGVLLQGPRAFIRALRTATGTWRQRLRTVLVGSATNSPTLPTNYVQWLLMFDNWSERRLAPVLATLPGRPAVHAIVFLTGSDSPALSATLASLRSQSYPISGIDVVRPGDAMPAPSAPFTAVLQAGEVLSRHAVPLLLSAMFGPEPVDGVFADEDCLQVDGTRFKPSFKPQPGLMMMCSGLLSRGVWLLRSALLPYGVASGWAECLRLQVWFAQHETAQGCRVRRVPTLLTHRRTDAEAAPPQVLAAIIDAGLQRRSVHATAVPVFPLRLRWEVDTQSMIDVIVPSRLRGAVQISCMLDVLTRTTHPNFSMHIVVTQDTPLDAKQMAAARLLEASGRVSISLLRHASFNYSTANNHAAGKTNGELVCLLNDDVSLIDGEWLGQMAARFSDPTTGIVGAKLYYPDERTQHGGVILGLAGLAEHAHKFLPRGEPGYMSRAILDQEMSAVTGACLMVRRNLFEQVGGLDERLPTGFNDVDFCLRIRALGYSVIMAASVELVHHETISFGHHYAGNAAAELADAQVIRRRWPEAVAADPYHNPNLSLRLTAEWELAAPPRYDAVWGGG